MKNHERRKVIIITDGDKVAQHVVEYVAKKVGGRCISLSGGNPTPLSGKEIVDLIKQAAYDPVLVMFDDNGMGDEGSGEKAIEVVASHPDIEVLGAIAVASNTKFVEGTAVDITLDNHGLVVEHAVNKDGDVEAGMLPRIYGDTVDVLNRLDIPLVVGVGDIGKMEGNDHIEAGAPVTTKAVEIILERSGYYDTAGFKAE